MPPTAAVVAPAAVAGGGGGGGGGSARSTSIDDMATAASEDIYFGGQQEKNEGGLLGQALQFISTTTATGGSRSDQAIDGHEIRKEEDDDEDVSHLSAAASFTEKSTPTFTTRKRFTTESTATRGSNPSDNKSKDTGESRIHLNHQYYYGNNGGNTRYRANNVPNDSTSGSSSRIISHQDTFRSSTSTYVMDNREGATATTTETTKISLNGGCSDSGEDNSRNNHNNINCTNSILLSSLRPHDPLCLSHRSLQSEDSHSQLHHNNHNLMVIPQSVDTVPTSNVATFEAYQRQQHSLKQQQLQQQRNSVTSGTNHNMDETELFSNRKPLQNSPEQRLQTGSISPPPQLSLMMANNNAVRTGGENNNGGRRTVFGTRVRQRYHTATTTIQQQQHQQQQE